MRHAILGAGAIGGLMGTVLSSLGEVVTVVVRPEKLATYPANLTLQRPSGAISARAQAVSTLTAPVDVLWIATKTYQVSTALETVQVSPAGVVPLLNGVDHVAELQVRFGSRQVIPGTIASETEKSAPGKFIQRSPLVYLNLAASGELLLNDVVACLQQVGFVCKFIANVQALLWDKLCFLAPFALVTSASGKTVGEVLADPVWKQKLTCAIAEACAVGNASGAQIAREQIEARFSGSPAPMRSSMQKDLMAGRELELDAIGGPIVRGGTRYRLDVSTTVDLMEAICSKASLPKICSAGSKPSGSDPQSG